MKYVDFHQFNFLISEELGEQQLEELTVDLFGVPLSSFHRVDKYRKAYRYFYTLRNMVNIYRNGAGDNHGTSFIEINGLGCDTLSIDFKKVIKKCFDLGYRIASIHLYIDDADNFLPMERLFTEFKNDSRNRIISKFKNVPTLYHSESRSLYFGSFASNYHIIFYEKGLFERVNIPWNRVELRLSNHEIIHAQLKDYINGIELGTIASGLLATTIDFKVDGLELKAKRATEKFWLDFLGSVKKRSFGRIEKPKPDKDKEIDNLRIHLERKIASLGIDAVLEIVNECKSKHGIQVKTNS